MNQKRSAELEAQVASLKDERADLYKTQGTNAQRLLDLNDILRLKDATLSQNKEEYVSESGLFFVFCLTAVRCITQEVAKKKLCCVCNPPPTK